MQGAALLGRELDRLRRSLAAGGSLVVADEKVASAFDAPGDPAPGGDQRTSGIVRAMSNSMIESILLSIC